MSRVLILGSGGREHALAWRLQQEAEVIWAPGNGAEECETRPSDLTDVSAIRALARELQPDLVIPGPEALLIAGVADALRADGWSVLGPGADGARLEADKAWSKELMVAAQVPTALGQRFTNASSAKTYVEACFDAGRSVVIKASGPALGKGVVVAHDKHEAIQAVDDFLVRGTAGSAGETIVIEERLAGFEFSLLTLVHERGLWSLPVAQDYKRVGEGDTGPNTGGMGTTSPVAEVGPDLVALTEEKVVRPILTELARRGISYRGVLFSGLMVDGEDLRCLEYNVRFGDPETQSVMRRLDSGFLAACLATARGDDIPACEVSRDAAITVVLAAKGYPNTPERGFALNLPCTLPPEVVLFHAGTSRNGDELVASGGRVLGVSATGETPEKARNLAYQVVHEISCPSLFFRRDIGSR